MTEARECGLLAAARRLARRAGRSPPVALERLPGGRNNRVFHARAEDGSALLLKAYFIDPRDRRDRLGAEWAFVTHAWRHGVTAVPEPVAADPAQALALYGLVPGRTLASSELDEAAIDAAADFVLAVNAGPRRTVPLAPASEACSSLSEHIDRIERRIRALDALDMQVPHAMQARRFVRRALAPAWAATKATLTAQARRHGIASDAPVAAPSLILSPSDFGFHNALVSACGRLTFLDFEYAGRDDPAKLVCDFLCQPAVPVPPVLHARFRDRLIAGLKLGRVDEARCRLLPDAYRIKWAAILLNEFLPLGGARRAFAGIEARGQACAAQLAAAERSLAHLSPGASELRGGA